MLLFLWYGTCINRDFPNGWAPLQHIIVEGLVRSRSQAARSLAQDIAVRWIRTNYVGYMKTGAMHEKYNVEKCGQSGGGGLYAPQVHIHKMLKINYERTCIVSCVMHAVAANIMCPTRRRGLIFCSQ